jgi:hypothetical protein
VGFSRVFWRGEFPDLKDRRGQFNHLKNENRVSVVDDEDLKEDLKDSMIIFRGFSLRPERSWESGFGLGGYLRSCTHDKKKFKILKNLIPKFYIFSTGDKKNVPNHTHDKYFSGIFRQSQVSLKVLHNITKTCFDFNVFKEKCSDQMKFLSITIFWMRWPIFQCRSKSHQNLCKNFKKWLKWIFGSSWPSFEFDQREKKRCCWCHAYKRLTQRKPVKHLPILHLETHKKHKFTCEPYFSDEESRKPRFVKFQENRATNAIFIFFFRWSRIPVDFFNSVKTCR